MAKKPSTKPAKPAAVAAPAPVSPELQQAKLNLQRQVGTGGISQAQADAQYAVLQTKPLNEVQAGNLAAAAQGSGAAGPAAPSSPQSQPYGAANGERPLASEAPFQTPTDIANTQDILNQQNASRQQALNRPNQLTPFGGQQYTQNPDGTISQISTIGNLDPRTTSGWTGDQYTNQSYIDRALQGIAGEGGENNQGQAGILPQLRGMFSKPLDYSNFSALPTADQFDAAGQQTQNKLYNQFASVNEPLFNRQTEQLRQQLADQGVTPGNELYTRQMSDLARQQNDARQSAQTQAMSSGQQYQQQLYQDAGSTRNQQIGEAQQLRAQPLTDLRGLLSSVNPVQLPSFDATAAINVPGTDFTTPATNNLAAQNNLEGIKLGGANALAVTGLQGANAANVATLNNNAASSQQQQGFQNQQNLNQQQFGFNQQLAGASKPSAGNVFAGIGGGFLGGLFGGLGGKGGQALGGFLGF